MGPAPREVLATRVRLAGAWLRARPGTAALLCPAAAGVVVLLDLVHGARHWPVAGTALLDEPAHLLTAALLLAAVLPGRARALVPWALLGSVLIDLDHVPLYLWGALTVDGFGRPVTHSAATVLVLVIAGAAARSRARTAFWGLALGVVAHLVRDLGTGPGVPLAWPLDRHAALLPYGAYLAVVLAAVPVAAGRLVRRRARLRQEARAHGLRPPGLTGSAPAPRPPGPARLAPGSSRGAAAPPAASRPAASRPADREG